MLFDDKKSETYHYLYICCGCGINSIVGILLMGKERSEVLTVRKIMLGKNCMENYDKIVRRVFDLFVSSLNIVTSISHCVVCM